MNIPLQTLYHRHQLLHHFKCGRAILYILFVYMNVVHHFLFSQMREFGTICRANFIDRAFIIVAVEELAGTTFIHPIAG